MLTIFGMGMGAAQDCGPTSIPGADNVSAVLRAAGHLVDAVRAARAACRRTLKLPLALLIECHGHAPLILAAADCTARMILS